MASLKEKMKMSGKKKIGIKLEKEEKMHLRKVLKIQFRISHSCHRSAAWSEHR